jgi:hypothetical protein
MVHITPPPSAGVQAITPSQLRLYKESWIAKCSSISPTIFHDFEELKARVVKLEGDVRKIAQDEGGN